LGEENSDSFGTEELGIGVGTTFERLADASRSIGSCPEERVAELAEDILREMGSCDGGGCDERMSFPSSGRGSGLSIIDARLADWDDEGGCKDDGRRGIDEGGDVGAVEGLLF